MLEPGSVNKLSAREIHAKNKNRNAPSVISSTLIWVHNIRSMHNIGSMFRTADAFAVSGLIMSGYSPAPPRQEISKTALGADETVAWSYFESWETALSYLKQYQYTIIGLEQTDQSVLISDLNITSTSKICIVPGNEIQGIDEDIMPHIDVFTEIPQYGNKHSLNVSVATGIALYALHEKSRYLR
jgi:23S rRNA (guanosine2251-2'-O)-methyltransferase